MPRPKAGEQVDKARITLSTPLERNSPTTEVARRIISEVAGGHLKPGARLPSERQLSESLGIGRSTVREAIATLDLLGIVDVRPGAGTFIKEATSELLPESIEWGLLLGRARTLHLAEARRHIEAILAQLAAERATPEGLVALRECYEKMASLTGTPPKFVKADIAFHLQLALMAENTALADILRSVRSLLEVWIRRAVYSRATVLDTLAEHEAVLLAVEKKDPQAAHLAMTRHMEAAARRLEHSLATDRPAQTP
jgi:DNA-binding FadR family transcriptional regulator